LKVNLRIRRYNPERDEGPRWDSYELELDGSARVLDALPEVRWHHDGTLGFRRSCAHGVCGSDAMVINGPNRLACVSLIRDVGPEITVEPMRGLPVIKDLVVDVSEFFAQYRSVPPCGWGEAQACEAAYDPAITMLGARQEQWLYAGLSSATRWNADPS